MVVFTDSIVVVVLVICADTAVLLAVAELAAIWLLDADADICLLAAEADICLLAAEAADAAATEADLLADSAFLDSSVCL